MKPLMFALKHSSEMSDASFRLLALIGEYPDPSGKTDICEVSVERLCAAAGQTWTKGRVTVACDDLRDLLAPIGLVGNVVIWRPDHA